MFKNHLPIRYPKIEIDSDNFTQFYEKRGKYPGVEKTYSEISQVWRAVFEAYPNNVFTALENKDLNQLKEAYENYYTNGISEGASSGKALNDLWLRWKKSKRNINRVKPLQEYFGLKILQSTNFMGPSEFYSIINKKISIPDSINIGQPWGWYYGDLFIHFELADYLYFSDIVIKILALLKIKKTCFLSDGSGLLSALIYKNCNVESSHHIDLAHFLLKQYLTNQGCDCEMKYHYAENFNPDLITDCQILINQDSFPEMKEESIEKYLTSIGTSKIQYVLSYNNEVSDNTYSDFRTMFMNYGLKTMLRFNSTVRPGYVIELFKYE